MIKLYLAYLCNGKVKSYLDHLYKRNGYFYLVLSFIFVGASMSLGKWLLESVNPFQLNTYCAVIGFVMTSSINWRLSKSKEILPEDGQNIGLLDLIIVALTGFALIAFCFDSALWVMPVSQTIILYYLYPIFIFLACRKFLGKEDAKFDIVKFAGLLLAFVGAILVATEGDGSIFNLDLSNLNKAGIIFVGLSIFTMVAYTIKVKKTEKEIPTLKFLMAGQIITFILGSIILTYNNWWISVSGIQIVGMIFTSVTYNLYSAFYLKATEVLPSQRLASWSYLEPIITAIIAIIFLGERLGTYAIIGSVLVLAGISAGYKEYTVDD